MNSKIKTTLFVIVFTLCSLTSSVSYAASLSVCGQTTAPEGGTAYDNYKDYQTFLVGGNINGQTVEGLISQLQNHKISQEEYYKRDAAYKSAHNICQASDIFKQIARIVNFLIGFIGLFVIVRLVISGFQMVLSQGNEEALKGAKSGITNALIGMALVFAAYLLANIIFQIAGVRGFNLNPFA